MRALPWVVVLAALTSCGTQQSSAFPGEIRTPTPPVAPAVQTDCDQYAAYAAIEELGHSRFRSTYTYAQPCDHGTFVIYRVPDAGFERAARTALPGVPIEFRDAVAGYGEWKANLAEVKRRDRADASWEFVSGGPTVEGIYRVGVLGDADRAELALRGVPHVTVFPGERAHPA